MKHWAQFFRVILIMASFGLAATSHAQDIKTKATHALIMDGHTGRILYEKNGSQPIPPASMSKLMTVAIALDMIKKGELTPDTPFDVSEKAWRTGGSKMFVLVDTQIRLEDLLRGLMTVSGNDAAIVIAENTAESEEGFSRLMNQKAKEWGLTNSQFSNPHGMTNDGQRMSVHDLGKLAKRIWDEHPNFRYLFSQPEMTWSEITQQNRNPLLGLTDGADGMKTGHTDEAGFGLVGSAEREGTRRIIVVSGLTSTKERREESLRMIEIAFQDFKTLTYFSKGDIVDEIPVFGGKAESLPVKVDVPLDFTRHRSILAGANAKIIYRDPIIAPIREGEQVALLRLSLPGESEREYPLYAAKTVGEMGFLSKMALGLRILFTPPELVDAE